MAAAIMPLERGAKECEIVLKLAALAVAAVSAVPTPALTSTAPWWEKVTVTIAGDGQPQGCEYRTSLLPGAKACDVVGSASAMSAGAESSASSGGAKGDQYTRLTFERRFRPGAAGLSDDSLPTGDTLLGRQVLALAIDGQGAVKGCKIVATAGDMTPDYGCKEAAAEKFETSVASSPASGARQGYMSILVYGHAEHVA